MKNRIFAIFLFAFCCCFEVNAQINWQHTNGPEGGAFQADRVRITDPLYTALDASSTEFKIFTQGALSGAGQINLFNAEGQSFQTIKVPDTSAPVTMPVKNVPPGMYFIQIKDVKAQMWGKILIKR